MLLMSCQDLSRGFDRDPVFEGLGFELYHGERVGLVGPNGCGKSTLMRLLSGEDQPDVGTVRLHAGARLGVLQQHAEFPAGRTLFEEAKSAFAELTRASEELVEVADQMAQAAGLAEQKQLADRYDRLSETLSRHDAFTLDHKVEEVLSGLGFLAEDFHRDLNTFSGGQQRRALLAKLLLSGPDVFLLDEPSNHLDIDTVQWLENYLVGQPQAMLIVSHDRYFLDKVVTKIFEMHEGKLTSYPGNYKQYVRLREERFEQQSKEYEAQREFIAKQEDYIKRVNYGQLAKQAQSRAKQLDKVERFEKPTKIEAPRMAFGSVMRAGDVVFQAEELTKAFGDNVLFKKLSFAVQRGKRLGIMGPNGCGKTTLLKILLGAEEPTSGEVRRGHLTQLGYLDQQLALLDESKELIQAVWPEPDPDITIQKMRDLLSRFGLSGPIIEEKVATLSGGERSRAALARLVVEGANVLILDEPTNHLDLWACDALEDALMQYEGTTIVVSHDRYFLNRVCDLLVVFHNGYAEVVYGNFDLYQQLKASRDAAEAEGKKKQEAKAAPSASSSPPGKAARRKRKFPYRKAVDLEADIAKQEELIAALEVKLTSPDTYRDANKVRDTGRALEEGKAKLAQLYEHWEEAAELGA